MKLYMFGSCSGTEPYPGRRHTAFALEVDDRLYWFDAGEGCSYTAHLMGLDLLRVSDVFVSHTHMDHVGGLANLLWNIRKLSSVTGRQPAYGDVTVYTPDLESWNGVMTLLRHSEGGYQTAYQTLAKQVADGVLLDHGQMRVAACHNLHLGIPQDGVWRSFSYRIEAQGKTVVYSGDLGGLADIEPWLRQGCDLLLMETGHHHPWEVCRTVRECGYPIGQIGFMHHGRDLLDRYEDSVQKCLEQFSHVHFFRDEEVFVL